MSEGIVYQNKDVEFKMISETFKEKSFAAYGLDLPKIKAVLPTNLPAVFANEMRIDNVFLLEDDSVAIVDYESEDKVSNRIKYVNYIGKFIDEKYADNIRRFLSMTKVARLYEEEKLEAVNLARKDERRETRLEMIENLIKAGADTLMLMEATGLTREELEEIKNSMLTTK